MKPCHENDLQELALAGIETPAAIFDESGNALQGNEVFYNLCPLYANRVADIVFCTNINGEQCPIRSDLATLAKLIRNSASVTIAGTKYEVKKIIVDTLPEKTLVILKGSSEVFQILRAIIHEIKNDLGALSMLFEELLKTISDERLYRIIRIAQSQDNILLQNLDTFSQWARLSEESPKLQLSQLKFPELFQDIWKSIELNANFKGVTGNFHAPECSVISDRFLLWTILQNLLSNAIKFSPRGGFISVTLTIQPEGYWFQVQNIGVMDSESVRLFNEGKALPSTNGTEGERGTGLGLRICQKYVQKLGGKIWVESSDAYESTVFSFTVPIQDLTTSHVV